MMTTRVLNNIHCYLYSAPLKAPKSLSEYQGFPLTSDFYNENLEPPATICDILSNYPSSLISITLEEKLLSSQTSGRFDPVQASGKKNLVKKRRSELISWKNAVTIGKGQVVFEHLT